MKKIIVFSIILFLSLTSTFSYASISLHTVLSSDSLSIISDKTHADSLAMRLNEIKEIVKTNISAHEKKLLRKELKSLNRELVKSNGGIYLSITAILLIILLLVVLL